MHINYLTGELIKEVRRRKGWQQVYLQNLRENDTGLLVTLSRVENLHQQPTYETMSQFMDMLDMPVDTFFCPYLENNAPEAFHLRERLLFYLERLEDETTWDTTADLLNRLSEALDMDSIINRQFILSCQVRLKEATGGGEELLPLIKEGISMTYPEFDEKRFAGEILLFEEVELLHSLALVYGKTGRDREAIRLLFHVLEGLDKLPLLDDQRKKRELRTHDALARLLISNKEYDKALEVCESGLKATLACGQGRYMPNFLYKKALCCYHIGQTQECTRFMRGAYFYYGLVNMKKQMDDLRDNALDKYGIQFDTYGLENLPLLPLSFDRTIGTFSAPMGHSAGSLVRQFRIQAGAKPRDIYHGICSQGYYSNIESGRIQQIDPVIFEALIQRLGRDSSLYFNTLVPKDVYEDRRLRQEIYLALSGTATNQNVEHLLKELTQSKGSQQGPGLQNVKLLEAKVCQASNRANQLIGDGTTPDTKPLEILLEAIKVTRPEYDEDMIATYRLTQLEIAVLIDILHYLVELGEAERGMKVAIGIQDSIRKFYVDENIAETSLSPLLCNYMAYNLLNLNNVEEAQKYEEELGRIILKWCQTNMLPGWAQVQSAMCQMTDRKEEAIAYTAMAYYAVEIIGSEAFAVAIRDNAKANFGVEFE